MSWYYRQRSLLPLSFLLLLVLSIVANNVAAAPTVTTTYGDVIGVVEGDARHFRGIPYARPPVGGLRWQPPERPEPWNTPRVASQFGPPCVQTGVIKTSEDCLTLNISTPASVNAHDKLPVLVWIHGGGFVQGTGSTDAYGSQLWNKHGIILVTINYRLGALGFFAHPALNHRGTETDNHCGMANYGLLDMVAALEWLKGNIAGFGGDPQRVTIAGISAGGMAVQMLMASPRSNGLFHAAIAQSGYAAWPLPRNRHAAPLPGSSSAEAIAARIAERALDKPEDASVSAQELYGVKAERLAMAIEGFHLPVVDGTTLVEEPGIVFRRGQQRPVPYISGGNSYDGSVFPYSGLSPVALLDVTGGQKERVINLYEIDLDQADNLGAKHLFGDLRYVLAARYTTEQMHKVRQPGYRYLFDYVPPDKKEEWPGAPHGSEGQLLFNDESSSMAAVMRGYWINFIKTGNPNGEGLLPWPVVKPGDTRWMVFQDKPVIKNAVRRNKLDLLELIYNQRVGVVR